MGRSFIALRGGRSGAVIALALVACAGSASAGVQTVSAGFNIPLSGGTQSLSLPGFNPALGTLTGVSVSVNAAVFITAVGTNTNPSGPNTFSGSYVGSVAVLGIPDLPLSVNMSGNLPEQTVAPFGFESGFVWNPGPRSASGSASSGLISGAEMPGLGNPVLVDVRGTGSWQIWTSSNSTSEVTNFHAAGEVIIEYSYAVPSAGSAALMGLGGLLAARRRR